MAAFDHPLAEAARREVIDLHALFETWLGGACPETEAAFARVEHSLAPSFTVTSPDGTCQWRDEVIADLRSRHGAKGRKGPFRIVIADVELLHVEPPLVALRYVEDQRQGEARAIRRSTALFRASARSESGVEWVALHECWMTPDD